MITGGEFNSISTITNSNLEFEKYCKDEGLSSVQLKREIYQLYTIRKINFFKNLLKLIKKYNKSKEIIKSN